MKKEFSRSANARVGKSYATPQLSRFGCIREVTSGSIPAGNPKTGPAIESNVGIGGGDVRRP